jgi:hypothetical protein
LALNRFLPAPAMHHVSRLVLGIPRYGALRPGTMSLPPVQKAMVFAAKVLPQPVMQRVATLAMRFTPAPDSPVAADGDSSDEHESEKHG